VQKYQLTVPGRFESLPQITDFIGQAARDAGFDEDQIFNIQMAVDEACSNIIEHAYGADCRGDIALTCCLELDNSFVVTIHDTGQPFDPQSVPDPPLGASLEDLPEGGLGLYFMRKLMDKIHFEFDRDHGNVLTMVNQMPA
jgi:serine/threonine-protein kinase RsbW